MIIVESRIQSACKMADGVDVAEGITEDFLQYIRKHRKRIERLAFTDEVRKNYLVNAFMFPAVDTCLDPFGLSHRLTDLLSYSKNSYVKKIKSKRLLSAIKRLQSLLSVSYKQLL